MKPNRTLKHLIHTPSRIVRRLVSQERINHYQKQVKPRLPAWESQPDPGECLRLLEEILTKNIVPFWYPQVIDRKNGGYRLNYDIDGNFGGDAGKGIVAQTRMIWFLSRLASSPYGTVEHLAAAKHGFDFISKCLWDPEYGGFFWEVDPSGETATLPGKHMYGQAFGLYALSEYALVSNDPDAVKTADELFLTLERKAHDKNYGGYNEFFNRDWGIEVDRDRDYINYPSGIKTFNTHIHIIEALTSYYALSKNETALQRLNELTIVLSNSAVRKLLGFCTDRYTVDWKPILDSRSHLINYGHDLENISLLILAYETTGGAVHPLLELFETIFSYSLKYGYDRKQGGFYRFGSIKTKAYRREKNWWVQAEGLLAALQMYRITQREDYFNCFAQTLDWISRHQVDWENGEWFEHISPKGMPSGPKAGPWKTPYHNGRAVLECIKILESFKQTPV